MDFHNCVITVHQQKTPPWWRDAVNCLCIYSPIMPFGRRVPGSTNDSGGVRLFYPAIAPYHPAFLWCTQPQPSSTSKAANWVSLATSYLSPPTFSTLTPFFAIPTGLFPSFVDRFCEDCSTQSIWTLSMVGALSFISLALVVNVLRQLLFNSPYRPPVVFHWFPFIGSTVRYGIDPYKFFLSCREKVCR